MDSIKTSVPLFIRLLEFSREDSASDLDLHYIAEAVSELSEHKTLTMKDYELIIEHTPKNK
jgi:hypothetical protein